jgi:hypothetical protein
MSFEDYLGGFYSHGHPDADHSVDRCGRTDHTFTIGFGSRCSPRILSSYILKRNGKGLMILEDILFSSD